MIGIYQGRLTFSNNKLQKFPKDPFNEFEIASKLNYDFIEFFLEEDHCETNPIWSISGINQYKKFCRINKLKILTLCDNYYIKNKITSKQSINRFFKIIKKISLLKIKKYIIPLFGKSRLSSSNKKKILKNLSILSSFCSKHKIELLIESNMSPKMFDLLKASIKCENLYFLFDIGNRVVLKKRSFSKDILLFGNNIRHIHLKDKNALKKNVLIGSGLVNFNLFFLQLKKINYKGSYTIESQRGKNIKKQANKNILFFKKLIKKYKL